MTMLDKALALASEGFRVFPAGENAKVPVIQRWPQRATTEPDQIKDLWRDPVMDAAQPYNIGVATGDGMVVIDVDNKNGKSGSAALMALELEYGDLPETYTVETPNGGEHRYFQTDERISNSVGKIHRGVDIRGDGGFVIAEGSRIEGRAYARRGSCTERAALPVGWARALIRLVEDRRGRGHGEDGEGGSRQDSRSPGPVGGRSIDPAEARRQALAYLDTAPVAVAFDGGNNTTYQVACEVKDRGVATPLEALDVMGGWNDRCEPPWPVDEILPIIESAYKTGKNPIGSKARVDPEAEFEAVEGVDRRSKPARKKLFRERWDDIDPRTEEDDPLIENWFDLGAMVVTYGESGKGKTNVVLSQCVAIASGQPWGELDVRKGLVVYVAAEGGRGIKRRIEAYKRKMGLRAIAFDLVPCPVDLLRPTGDTKALIALIREAERDHGSPCLMVVIDTASRALAGGNENAPDDMGALVMHCDQIRDATKATLHLIHHSGKNKAAGARGHSLLRAATDTEIEIDGDAMTITATKQRDRDMPRPMTYRYESVVVGRDRKGRDVPGIVTLVKPESDFEDKLTGEDEDRLSRLVGMVRGRLGLPKGDEITEEMSRSAITSGDLAAAWSEGVGQGSDKASRERSARRFAEGLVRVGQMRCEAVKGKENKYFLVGRTTRTDPDKVELSGSKLWGSDNPDKTL